MTDAAKAAESQMYRIMGALSRLPIIFKGAMITNLVLEENGFDEFKLDGLDDILPEFENHFKGKK